MTRRLLVLALALGFALGCERVAIVKKCRALARQVNPELDAIAESVGAKQDAPTYQAAAERYAKLAKALEGADIGEAELDRAISDYAATLRASSRHVNSLAQNVDGGRPESLTLARRELEQEAKRQKNAAKRFEKECQGH